MAINIEGTLNACPPFTSCCMVPGIMYDPCYNPCQLRPLRSTFPLNWERLPENPVEMGGGERRGEGGGGGRGRGRRGRKMGRRVRVKPNAFLGFPAFTRQ